MCGIAGIFAYHYAANPIDSAELIRIRDYMAARGPDGKGIWESPDGRVGFGHRRLSIIDLTEAGAQPMVSADARLVVTFNGEIYNYRDLREKLEAKGRVFRTHCDTEVLLHLYDERGEEMVHALRGMFAFAIWDANKQSLFLARDPYGIKPLYYSDDGWTLRFASQVKALLAGGRVSRDPEPAGLVGFCLFGSVPEPYTTFREIRSLPAGATLWVDRIGPREPKSYFSVAGVYQRAESDRAAPPLGIRDALLDSVRHHLVADVPVGAFLSAGVDSGALVGLMGECGKAGVQTVTLAFKEFLGKREDEALVAAQVATQYGTRHTTRIVTEREFHKDLPKIFEAMDQPTIDGINTWFVSKAARELGLKVAISGVGGDELFGGYPSFRDLPRWTRMLWFPSQIPLLGEFARRALGALRSVNPKAAGMLKYGGSYAGAYLLRRGLFMPWELDALLGRETARIGLRRLAPVRHIRSALEPEPASAFGKVAALEASLYMRNQLLRDTDWASMAHSLEVRTPLVDATLLSCVAKAALRQRLGKHVLANSPSVPLPLQVSMRPKSGFATPVQIWLERVDWLQRWKCVPGLAMPTCAWARRWAYQVVDGLT